MPPLNPSVEEVIKSLSTLPEMQTVLGDRVTRSKIYKVLLSSAAPLPVATEVATHSLVDCRRAVLDSGFEITKPRPKFSTVSTGYPPATAPNFSLDSQQGKMLRVFAEAGNFGLTDDEAAEDAGLGHGIAASPWKRAGELRESGLIGYIEGEGDTYLQRAGLRGVMSNISVVTNEGKKYYEEIT